MVTVRFPTGFSVQYNDVGYIAYNADGTYTLYDCAAKSKTYAIAPKECLIEHRRPCRTYSATTPGSDELYDSFMEQLRTFGSYKLADLKRKLTEFDGKSRRWKS